MLAPQVFSLTLYPVNNTTFIVLLLCLPGGKYYYHLHFTDDKSEA